MPARNESDAMRLKIYTLLLTTLACQWSLAQTTFTRPADAIKYRQAAYQVMSMHSQRIGNMIKGERPFDKTLASQDALMIELLASQLEAAFAPGTLAAPSKAKPEVWQEPAQFKQKMDEFKLSARKLSEATKSGDMNNIQAAFNHTAQTCKSCHEGFRNR